MNQNHNRIQTMLRIEEWVSGSVKTIAIRLDFLKSDDNT